MALSKTQSTTMWILSVLLAAAFIFGGVTKLIGSEDMVSAFNQFGYPGWFRILIGIIELVCGIGLLLPKYAIDAASFLIIIMLGAILTLFFNDQSVIPPLVTLILIGSVAALRGDE
jgi:uncharacterized membrane protein YphA (DoxX/SURF4 family)